MTRCEVCGARLEPEWKYCIMCGARVGTAPIDVPGAVRREALADSSGSTRRRMRVFVAVAVASALGVVLLVIAAVVVISGALR